MIIEATGAKFPLAMPVVHGAAHQSMHRNPPPSAGQTLLVARITVGKPGSTDPAPVGALRGYLEFPRPLVGRS